MKVLAGSIPWWSKVRKVLLCMVVLICIIVFYHSYISGTISMDVDLIKDIETSRIETQWEHLLSLGFEVAYYDEPVNYSVMLTCQQAEQLFDVDLVQIYIRTEHSANIPTPSINATYRRVGLFDAMWDLGSIGECTSRVTIEAANCAIYMVDYDDSDGRERRFCTTLQTILNAIE